MKTIKIEGQKFEVPDWVSWTAQNKSGRWYGYSERPKKIRNDVVWELFEGLGIYISTNDESKNWEKTLRKV